MKETMTKSMQENMTPDEALEILKKGNENFSSSYHYNHKLDQQVKDTAGGQAPFAIVLGCIDSRVPCEIIFDQGVGDIFSCRVAGNIVNEDVLGSMEFSCKLAGSKVIVVLGHTKCGAVKGACDGAELGNLTGLLSKVKPAVDAEVETTGDRSSSNLEFVDRVAKINVGLVKEQILNDSPVLAEMIKEGSVKLVGAMYHVESGKVEFYD